MTETTRIRWEPTQYGGWTGHVGTLEPWAYQIWKPGDETPEWRLTSALFGQYGRRVDNDNPGALKAEAERWLEEFVSSLGASFEPEPAKSRKSRAWHADWAEAGRDPDGNAILRHKPTGGRYKILPIEEC